MQGARLDPGTALVCLMYVEHYKMALYCKYWSLNNPTYLKFYILSDLYVNFMI